MLGLLAVAAGQADAGVVLVNSINNSYTGPGTWYQTELAGTSTYSVVGNAPGSHAEVYPGAAYLTTGGTSDDKVEVSVTNGSSGYGTAATIIPSISLSYDFYKAASSGNAASAPALRLSFLNNLASPQDPDQYVTLVYEPNWQPGPTAGSVPTDQWFNSGPIDAANGLFWSTGGFGTTNSAGGPPLHTLQDWLNPSIGFNSDFQSASLVAVRVGLGSGQKNQIGYFDNVRIDGTNATDTTYDFGVAAVPEPATLISAGIACVLCLGVGLRRRKANRAA
jgi:hypothetical protein